MYEITEQRGFFSPKGGLGIRSVRHAGLLVRKSTYFRLFAPVVGVARLVGSGRRAWLKRTGCVNLLFVKPIVKVGVFVTEIATAFCNSDIFQAYFF